ncbi:ketoacyl-ACP synthase III [Paenibacillus abyssi]|uniref:Beta-ketoacyl-[acyl-carrier-protein] synthase III n=1 Tax=Paenibacillus abyssi TaxID=1340531 RepID=A0A917CUE4_9BACL|nr:ketoacyl-ACP synthase III [Paenibacillus abyssi]GGF98658.1 3-oxoacyl-[acyl-carrier-protein] synthase 3 protein 2 [Paenibacillus abyssi]
MAASEFHSNARITAIGTYVPERILTNEDLEQMVDTNHEWIVQRTGIVERRIAADDQYCSDLCYGAVRSLLENYPVTVEDVDYILVATSTPDTFFPSVASRVQAYFGIQAAGAVDLQAACAGFVSALQVANGLLLSGAYRKILVIGAETLSKITDYTDRTTCILFGDGAGAVLVEPGDEGTFVGSYAITDGSAGHHLYRSSLSPTIGSSEIRQTGHIVQNGREVYKWAVTRIPEGIQQLLASAGLSVHDIDWFIPHSANLRIIESICERTGIPMEHTLHSLVYNGNTSAASIPLALHAGVKDGRVQPGNLLLLYGFGGGLTQAALVVKWSIT